MFKSCSGDNAIRCIFRCNARVRLLVNKKKAKAYLDPSKVFSNNPKFLISFVFNNYYSNNGGSTSFKSARPMDHGDLCRALFAVGLDVPCGNKYTFVETAKLTKSWWKKGCLLASGVCH